MMGLSGANYFRRGNKLLKKHTARKLRSLKYLWGFFFGERNFERFAIVGYARTGSNFLTSGLDISDSTRLHHEIFAAHNREIGKGFEKRLAILYQKQIKSIKAVGFKLFYYHLTDEEWEKFLRHDEFKIIHITRRNILATIVSLDIALKTDRWHSSISIMKPEKKKIMLDSEHLVERFEQVLAYEKITRDRYKDQNILEVVYEVLVNNPENEFKRIGKYLNITDLDPEKITLRKQNPEKFSELIANYDEIAQCLTGTKFEQFLDE